MQKIKEKVPLWAFFIIQSEREAQAIYPWFIEKSEYERPDPIRPGPMTLLTSWYICNHRPDSRMVFFDG